MALRYTPATQGLMQVFSGKTSRFIMRSLGFLKRLSTEAKARFLLRQSWTCIYRSRTSSDVPVPVTGSAISFSVGCNDDDLRTALQTLIAKRRIQCFDTNPETLETFLGGGLLRTMHGDTQHAPLYWRQALDISTLNRYRVTEMNSPHADARFSDLLFISTKLPPR